ncbi:MAG: hypothetical protein IJV72_06490, partial [Clostridia bacterium]|nr:hypothetical protein [Clostridia bacterium]
MTVRLQFVYLTHLRTATTPENLTIWYIDDNGEVSTVDGATYVVIGDQGYAVFETDHFSYYTVTKLTPAQRCERDGKHLEKTIIQEANCLVGGYVKVVCTRCGEVIKNETTPALGHNWTHNVISEATCDTAGKTEHSCDRCRLVYYTVTAAVGHKWTESKTVEATCSEAGYILYVCESNEAHTYKVAIPKSSHSYVSETVEATCTSEGYTKHVCSECGVSYVTNRVNAKGHSIITKVVEPTCISEGYTAQSCEHCGQRFENINPTPTVDHVWDIEAPTCSKGQTCTVCNAAGAAATGEHNMTEKGECSECGKACEHKFYQGEVHAPTCIENGYTEYVCNFCGIVENRDIVEHGDHTWKNAEHKAATCTDDGYDKWICSVCGETKTETIPHGDGFHKEATKVVAPTCEGEGYTLRYCRICETEIERTNIVDATGHRYATVETVEPTCEDDGYITVKCAGCGDEATKVLEAKGHSHELYKTIEPTCDKAGADIYKCIACDSSYEKEIAPKGHNYEHYETIEPTCDKAGADIYKCIACDSSYEKEIAPKGHNYEHYETIEPTCDKSGADVYKCTACDSSYEKEIAPKGHNYELYETVDSTCEVNGKKIYKCTACDSTEEEELELADHKYVDGKCEVCGKEQSDCVHLELEDCDKSYKFVNDSAHSCNDGVEVIYTCPNCEQVVLKEIKDSHTYEYNDFADIGVAGNVWVRSCVICNEGDVNIEFYGCKFRTTEKEYVDDEGYPHYAETFVCVDCGFSYVRDVRLIEDGCYVAYEYTYTFGSEAWGKQYTAVVVNFVESHNYKTEWTESVDEENLIFSEIGVRACTECGKVFLRSTETMKYLAEDVPYEYTSVTELALDDKGTEFVIVEKEIQRAEYKITEDGEYIPVGFEENEFTYDSKGNPASLEENIERYTEEGEVEYFYAALYYYIGGEKQLMGFEEEEYTTITLPGGYEKNFIVSNKAGEYDINGELVDSYSETYAYEIIEGESCSIKVTYTDSEGNVETYVDDVHPNIEKTWEFATEIQDCNQGIYLIEKCTVCGEEINREYRSHHNTITTEEDHIDASELGCASGGYVSLARCQYCDYETVYYHYNCQIATEDSDSSYDDSYGEIVIVKPEVSFGDSDIAVEDTVIG